MGTHICTKCGCMENTAHSTWHHRCSKRQLYDVDVRGQALCSACMPKYYKDGTVVQKHGWHKAFSRVMFDPTVHKYAMNFPKGCVRRELESVDGNMVYNYYNQKGKLLVSYPQTFDEADYYVEPCDIF